MDNYTSERIRQLKQEIENQRGLNLSLFNQIPLASHSDPTNEKAEPILKQWREGSIKIKELIKELNMLETECNKQNKKQVEDKQSFINGYGEATNREITSTSHDNYQKRLSRQMLWFVGGK